MTFKSVYNKERGVCERVLRSDAIKDRDRWYVPTSAETKWVANWVEFVAAGGVVAFNEDQTEIELLLPEPYKFSTQFQREHANTDGFVVAHLGARQTPQYDVRITADFITARVLALGVDPEREDNVIVQELVDGKWIERATYNSLSNDSAYTNARDYADRLRKTHLRRAAVGDPKFGHVK